MDTELLRKIARLEEQVATLAGEQIPKVERASKRRDRRQIFGGLGMFAIATLMAGTMSASALSGTSTVDSGDIKNGQVKADDLASNSVTSAKVKDGTLTRADLAPALYESLTAMGQGKSVTIWEGTFGGVSSTPVLDVSSFARIRVSQHIAPETVGACGWIARKKMAGVAVPAGPQLGYVSGDTKLFDSPGNKIFLTTDAPSCAMSVGSIEGFR